MTTNKIAKTALLLGTVYFLAACSQGGFQTPGSTDGSSSNNSSSTGPGGENGGGASAPALDKVDMKGYSDGGSSENALVVDFDKANMAIVVSVPITLAGLNMSLNISHPSYPEIQFYNYIDANGMSRMAVRVPVKYLLRNLQVGTPKSLPNGQVIPFLGGEMPSTSVVINANDKSKVHLYLGSGAIAVYVSHPSIPSYVSAYYNIRNQAGTKVIGAVGIAAKTSVGDGGFVVSVKIPDQYAKILDDYIGSY